ncbi:hypothetical protein JB92DRAFT_3147569 [Gautieria morchelliformis]|nr:hypothetical protein JB92DRAFT_3147569 [Gautieria morchelliformis]
MLTTRLARVPTFAVLARRAYSDYPGSVAQSQGFGKKEKAHEDQYARQKEMEELKKIREQLKLMAEKVENLEKNGKAEADKEVKK